MSLEVKGENNIAEDTYEFLQEGTQCVTHRFVCVLTSNFISGDPV